jgi:hypothetical protein
MATRRTPIGNRATGERDSADPLVRSTRVGGKVRQVSRAPCATPGSALAGPATGRVPGAVLGRGVALPVLDTIEVDSLRVSRPRSVGVESVGLWAMAQLECAPRLETLGPNGPARTAITARMAAPDSERATRRWWVETSGLGDLLDVDFAAMNLMRLVRRSEGLLRHSAKLEATLFARVRESFGWTGRSRSPIGPIPSW